MDRQDDNYYDAHAQTIDLDKITSNKKNAAILQQLRDNDPTFDFLQIQSEDTIFTNKYDFTVGEEDDLGWLGYFVGNSYTLGYLYIHALPEKIGVHRLGAFIEGLNRNQSIQALFIWVDLGSGFRQMGDFFRNNSSLTELSFDNNMAAIGIESARSIAFMLSQCEQSTLQKISFEESNASDEVLAEIFTAFSTHSQLVELNLGDNNLGREGSVALGNALKACRNPQLEILYLWNNSIDDEGLRGLVDGMKNCHNLTWLHLSGNSLVTLDGCRSLCTLFQSEHCNLKDLDLSYMNIENDGARAIAQGLVGLNSLERLILSENAIGDEGARALGAGVANLHLLEDLDLEGNSIGDLGLQAFAEGLIHCVNLKYLFLSNNGTITASRLTSLSTLLQLQPESCSLTVISLRDIPFGDDGAVALVDALEGNKSMKKLYFDPDSARVTSVGWKAFSKLLCDTSSVNNTYLSNHSLEIIGGWNNEGTPDDVKVLLDLNKLPFKHVAMHKILKSHSDFDVELFFEWKLKLLPIAVSWFERVMILADEHSWISDETSEEFQCRQLSAMYNFVRGMPLLTIDGYRSRNSTAVLAPSRKRKIEQLQLVAEI